MVRKESPLYLFIGQDSLAKDTKIKQLKQEFIPKEVEQFNTATLYGRELKLMELQENILCLPVKTKKRVLIIKGAEELKKESKDFILNYCHKPNPQLILILDIEHTDSKDEFLNGIARYAQVYRFKEEAQIDTFTLSRQIELGRPDYALKVLHNLLQKGERPERILGGLRYAWQRIPSSHSAARKRLKFLLNCDLDIKTGKLKPAFALEKLVVYLCGTQKFSR